MSTRSLLIDFDLQSAHESATKAWGWEVCPGDLFVEYRRPDNYEVVRFLPDHKDAPFQGLKYGTTVYLGDSYHRRLDAARIDALIEQGVFMKGDPELPPPRPRVKKDYQTEYNKLYRK